MLGVSHTLRTRPQFSPRWRVGSYHIRRVLILSTDIVASPSSLCRVWLQGRRVCSLCIHLWAQRGAYSLIHPWRRGLSYASRRVVYPCSRPLRGLGLWRSLRGFVGVSQGVWRRAALWFPWVWSLVGLAGGLIWA